MAYPTIALGDVITVERAAVQPQEISSGTLYVGLEHITADGSFTGVAPVQNGDLASTKFAFTSDHILYGKLRPYLRKIARPAFSGVCSTDILPLTPGPRIDSGYLYHYLRTPEIVSLATARSSGANLPRISPDTLREFPIPLPPLPEQQRIAAILDQADALRRKRREAIAKLDTLLQSVFLEMFGDPVTNPRSWPIGRVNDLCTQITDGVHKTPTYQEMGVPFISTVHISSEGIDWQSAKFISEKEHRQLIKRCRPQRGDILYTKVGSVGLALPVTEDREFSIFVQLALLKPDPERCHFQFLSQMLNMPSVRQRVLMRLTGATMKYIGIGDIGRLPAIIPSVEHQRRFARFVERFVSVREVLGKALQESDRLFSSIQHLAFSADPSRGECVAIDPEEFVRRRAVTQLCLTLPS